MSVLFLHQGFNYKTGKYDIGYRDNYYCKILKNMMDVSQITIYNNCPKYIGYVKDINNNTSDYLYTLKVDDIFFTVFIKVPGTLYIYYLNKKCPFRIDDIIISPILSYSPISSFCKRFLNKF